MSDLQQLNHERKQAEDQVRRGEMLEKLMSNREFKKLILEFFAKDEPARLVGFLAYAKGDQRDQAIGLMDTISGFMQWMDSVESLARKGKEMLASYDDALSVIMNHED